MNGTHPPRLAQAILGFLLDAREHETILGDLIEQYREDIAPRRSTLRAWLWYWRQTMSFVSWKTVRRAGQVYKKRNPVLFWAAIVFAVQYFFTVLMPTALGFTMAGALFALLAVSLATSAFVSADFEMPWRTHGRLGFAGAFAMSTVSVLTINVGAVTPAAFVASSLMLFFASGFLGSWRASHAGKGTLLAMMVGMMGAALATPALLIGIWLGFEQRHPPLVTLLPTAAGVSVILGSLGAHAAKGLKALIQWKHRLLAVPVAILFSLAGCSGIAELVQVNDVSPGDALALAGLPFGNTEIKIRGSISTLLFPPSGGGMLVVKGNDGKQYAFLLAGTKAMARQGFSRFSIGPGEEVIVSGVLANNRAVVNGWTAARANQISTTSGKLIFERAPAGS